MYTRPVQRRHLRVQKKQNSHTRGFLLKFIIPLILVIAAVIFVKLTTHYWNGKDKFSFVFMDKNDTVGVVVLDPKLGEMTTITIPGETEVDVARNYGTLRIKNVWRLSQNEKLAGSLLPETVTQNFLFPVILWTGQDGVNISDSNFTGILKFIFVPDKTNISFGDRLSAGIFAIKVHDLDKTEVDLGKSQFLHKEKLNDGQSGYRLISGAISQRLGVYFSDDTIVTHNVRVYIVDATNQPGVASLVGQIVEVLGGKVVSIDKRQTSSDSDCEVLGSNKDINKKIGNLFSCTLSNGKTDFDLEIRLGTKFAKRF